MVAVTPTLEARPQLSSLLRGIESLLFLVVQCAAGAQRISEWKVVYDGL